MKSYTNSILSILVGAFGLFLLIRNNYNLSVLYLSAKGKTRGMFGIVETLNYYFKYYILVIIAVALLFAIFALRKKEESRMVYWAIGLCVLTVILVFIPLWKFMI